MGRRTIGGHRHGPRHGLWTQVHGHRQRRDGESRSILSDDGEESHSRAKYRHRKPYPGHLPRGLPGIFLPLQEDVFPDTDDFGRVFRNNAVMSAMGIPQITAIMGMCVAGGAYLPVMCDTILMTEGSGLFLAGPALVQAAIGAKYSAEELGGAAMHAQIAGTIDYREPNDEACLERIRSLAGRMGHKPTAPFDRRKSEEPAYATEEIYGIFESDPTRTYDVKEIIARLVDGSRFDEYKAEYGKTVICGYARIGGFSVGI